MKISLVQIGNTDGQNKSTRIENTEKLLSAAEELEGTDLIIMPELWGTGFFSFENYRRNAEDIRGETFAVLSDIAAGKKCYIFTGTFIESAGGKYYNTALLLDRQGEIISVYRKTHLFGGEKDYMTGGDEIAAVQTDIGIIGMSICYDLRFPELYRRMSEKGVQIFVSASAWPAGRKEHLRILNRARAVENQAFLFSCCMAGENKGVKYSGMSMAVSPEGNILYEAGEGQCVHTVEADIDDTARLRAEFPVLMDRRFY